MLTGMSGPGHSQYLRWVAVAGGAQHIGDIDSAVIVGCPVETGEGVAGGAVG